MLDYMDWPMIQFEYYDRIVTYLVNLLYNGVNSYDVPLTEKQYGRISTMVAIFLELLGDNTVSFLEIEDVVQDVILFWWKTGGDYQHVPLEKIFYVTDKIYEETPTNRLYDLYKKFISRNIPYEHCIECNIQHVVDPVTEWEPDEALSLDINFIKDGISDVPNLQKLTHFERYFLYCVLVCKYPEKKLCKLFLKTENQINKLIDDTMRLSNVYTRRVRSIDNERINRCQELKTQQRDSG